MSWASILFLEIIFQFQAAEETIAHIRRNVWRLTGGGVVEQDSFLQCIYNDAAIPTLGYVTPDLLA